MMADRLERIRHIGQRLRGWRKERDWSGQGAAAHISTKLERQVEWPELRAYEEGSKLPDTVTATCMAAVYGRELPDLLTFKEKAAAVERRPWPKGDAFRQRLGGCPPTA
ncbi:MAG: hypothetical protein U5R31_07585 [Acidimicrobiia bacterium]|nr:hypothetical protein [Acidimicrobiia bacterium]